LSGRGRRRMGGKKESASASGRSPFWVRERGKREEGHLGRFKRGRREPMGRGDLSLFPLSKRERD